MWKQDPICLVEWIPINISIASRFNRNLKTFTCGFDVTSASGIERGFDERVAAEALSAEFKTEHYEVVLKSGDMERCIEEFAYHLEEPRVGQSYPNFYAAKLASKFVKVVLSGAGGDELFGGYPWRYYKNFPASTFEEYASSYYNFWQRLATEKELCELFSLSGKILTLLHLLMFFAKYYLSMNLRRIPQKITSTSLFILKLKLFYMDC